MDYNSQLDALVARTRAGEVPKITGRQLLSWFGAVRRGARVVESIRREMKNRRLITDPDFNEVWVDVPLMVKMAEPSAKPEGSTAVREPPDVVPADPVHRIGRLSAANQEIVSISPNAPIEEAATLMMLRNFSQLPVMRSERDCKGAVTWESIGVAATLGSPRSTVDDCMRTVEEVSWDAGLLDAIPKIISNEFVLVRGPDRRFQGIVTVSDLSLQFRALSEPFLLLGQIENLVRILVARSFTLEEVRGARDPSDTMRQVGSVADLTFGEYVRLLEPPSAWGKLRVSFHRAPFLGELGRVRDIRNDVMHFDPDPLDESDLKLLRNFAAFLERALR